MNMQQAIMSGAPVGARDIALTTARRSLDMDLPLIATETEWRRWPHGGEAPGSMRVLTSRWQGYGTQNREVQAQTPGDGHLIGIVLRTMNLSLSIDGKCIYDGIATPGMLHVAEPGTAVRCYFRGPYDTLHLHVPNRLIAECLRDMPERHGRAMAADGLIRDLATERIARTLLAAGQDRGPLGLLFADTVGLAIVARLLHRLREDGAGAPRTGLAKWRLKRTIDHVEAHLGDPIRLSDMAEAAGLTRMHFAAQFKLSTGLRPHEYVLRRRIERAQEMLMVAADSVVEIALSVGFQTQSHFNRHLRARGRTDAARLAPRPGREMERRALGGPASRRRQKPGRGETPSPRPCPSARLRPSAPCGRPAAVRLPDGAAAPRSSSVPSVSSARRGARARRRRSR